jgi:glycerophosphoryl diester phosphodiesterase
MATFKKIAHRGASGHYPENSRLAFEKAIAAGADMIELDCQLSADGHVVVFHDERLARTTGARGKVYDKTLSQLRALDIGKWRKAAFRGEKILTLEEALEIFAGNVGLCLEIKVAVGAPPGIELKLLFILSHFDYLERTVISSFDYRSLARVRELAPEAALGVIYGAGCREDPIAAAERLAATSIHVQKELAQREFCDRAWQAGLDVYVWTVNDRREIGMFVDLGVQGIFSDFPEKLSLVGRIEG